MKVTGVEPDGALVQIEVEVDVIVTEGTTVGFTDKVLVAFTLPHVPPEVVSFKVINVGAVAEAV